MTRAEKSLAHAQAGVSRARARCDRAWKAWLEATDDRRRALDILAEAERDARAATSKEGET